MNARSERIVAVPVTAGAKAGAGLAPPALTVLYDGSCPLCRREVGVYRGLQPMGPLCFRDVSDPAQAVPPGAPRQTLMSRFHVVLPDGRMVSGARAFLALWSQLPGWRWLARMGRLPGMPALMEGLYRAFLKLRPALQRVAVALESRPVQGAVGVIPADLVADLRSDHAGETGAVMIYRGMLACTRDPGVLDFAARHLATEQRHLAQIEAWLPPARRSRLLGPWRLAGWLTGALPALCGPRAVYATVAAVETFVDRHYQSQIDQLAGREEHATLHALLRDCQADECHHRDEAAALAGPAPGWALRAWCATVGAGSAFAVALARRL
jgi:demethoxyubiquinone hydroxylase (CLK1/Coq7/Cat5 family)/predicted DCC family thiol-disulfide oxidoreductase YuxK